MPYTYLDYASATPLDPKVLKAMQPFLSTHFANPSSLHSAGRSQRKVLETARQRVAKVLGAKPAEIIFTSGSTESASIAIGGVARQYQHGRIVASTIEHEAVIETVRSYEIGGRQTGIITVGSTGVIDITQVTAAINDMTVLVCAQYVNNEVGTIQPIAKIAAVLKEVRLERERRGIQLPIYLYCDAAQAGLMPVQVARLGVDMMSFGGSKIYGPAGTGILYVRTRVELKPILHGGGQERGLRSGTENIAGAVGFTTAFELIQADRAAELARQDELITWLIQELTAHVQGLTVNCSKGPRLAGMINFTIAGINGETLVTYLDQAGFAVSTGSACMASSDKPSHVLLAIGLSNASAESSLRVSIGRPTTKREVQAFAKTLIKLIPDLHKHSRS